ALALANSTLVLAQSRLLARELAKKLGEGASPAAFIQAGFESVLCRAPTAEERSACEKFLADQAALLAQTKNLTTFTGGAQATALAATGPHLRARENLIHGLMNQNEFVTIR